MEYASTHSLAHLLIHSVTRSLAYTHTYTHIQLNTTYIHLFVPTHTHTSHTKKTRVHTHTRQLQHTHAHTHRIAIACSNIRMEFRIWKELREKIGARKPYLHVSGSSIAAVLLLLFISSCPLVWRSGEDQKLTLVVSHFYP